MSARGGKLLREIRAGCLEKVTCKLRSEGTAGNGEHREGRKGLEDNRWCEGPDMGKHMMSPKASRKARGATTEIGCNVRLGTGGVTRGQQSLLEHLLGVFLPQVTLGNTMIFIQVTRSDLHFGEKSVCSESFPALILKLSSTMTSTSAKAAMDDDAWPLYHCRDCWETPLSQTLP